MSLEPALLNELDKPKSPPKWCVYYEHDTGDIVTVTNRFKDFIKNPHIFTENDDARKVLMGHLDPKKFCSCGHTRSFNICGKVSSITS